MEEGGGRSGHSQNSEDAMLLDLKVEEGAMSQGMEEDRKSRKRHENVFSPRASRGMQPY